MYKAGKGRGTPKDKKNLEKNTMEQGLQLCETSFDNKRSANRSMSLCGTTIRTPVAAASQPLLRRP